ncbi:MAG: DNA repair protein RecN [Lachnospiraceae bacterium]|nr:DNA repair protein RecN [Lachnospiraceae bacterium]NBJ83698.1 DNA repair protein RecN [bacterium 1XD42-76]NBK06953.1 DNA repair protein RecN [bacterium 1XD42-94]
MLLGLHVKNLALIERADVEFTDGLNILTGETGAGKSIIIGSVGLALGAKASKDMIRQGEESALIELVFSVDDERKQSALKALDIVPDEDHQVIVSKKITQTRSMSRINDETVTAARLRSVTSLLLDIHGQHEHQSLLHRHKHLEILDEYSRKETGELKKQTAESYGTYMALKEALSGFGLNEEERRREMDFLRFEIEEIEQAEFKDGEEEALAARYRKFSHGQRIAECMQTASQAADSDLIGRALKDVESVVAYDGELQNILNQLTDAESLLNDLSRSIGDYMNEMEFDEAEFKETEERLDLIRGLMAKYGSTEEAVKNSLMKKKERLAELEHYEERLEETKLAFAAQEKELSALCEQLSEARKQAAGILKEKIEQELEDLNFLHVDFQIEVRRLNGFSAGGFDEVEFLISTNPGNIPPRPLGEVASGGELSRIMLAIKTVLADTDDIPTLIFDEIDTGISGRTAQKVSERLCYIAKKHQVLCITHLPQIAAMADTHFEIRKAVEKGNTVTRIHCLSHEEQIGELARLLGGAEITEKVRESAEEMKRLAAEKKSS